MEFLQIQMSPHNRETGIDKSCSASVAKTHFCQWFLTLVASDIFRKASEDIFRKASEAWKCQFSPVLKNECLFWLFFWGWFTEQGRTF